MPDRLKFYGQVARRSPPLRRIRSEDKAERDSFYGAKRWRDLRIAYLRENPLCVECLANELVIEATTVHHIKERLEYPELAYEWSNLEASCSPCHTRRHKAKSEQLNRGDPT